MDALILINYIVFALFLTTFMIEIGIALLLLLSYGLKDKLMKYLMPMWEIDGTFAIFYVVDLEATYPNILPAAGTIYILPVLLAALFFIFRNAFLAYGEYIKEKSSKKIYLRVYSIATIVVAFIAFAVLASSVSGTGVNLVSKSLNTLQMLFDPFNLLMFAAAAILSVFAAMVIFDIRNISGEVLSAVLAVAIVLVALQTYVHYVISNTISDPILLILPLILIIVAILLHAFKNRLAKYFAILAVFSGILSFEFAEFPYLFNSAINLNSILVSGPSAPYLLAFSIGGTTLLAILIGILIYINLVHKGDTTSQATGY